MNKIFHALLLTVVVFLIPQAQSAYLELIVLKPYSNLNWDSPTYLAQRINTIENFNFILHANPLGHALVHLRCNSLRDKISSSHLWTSFTGEDNGEASKNLRGGRGLGIFLDEYPGRLMKEEDVLNRSEFWYEKFRNDVRIIRFEISENQCLDAFYFYHRLSQIEGLKFGFSLDPFEFRGAGCSNYAAAFVKVTDQYVSVFDWWKRHLEISQKLIGFEYGNKKIPIGLFFDKENPAPWTYEGVPNVSVSFYDPQLIFAFIETVRGCLYRQYCPWQIEDWMKMNKVDFLTNEDFQGIEIHK